MFLIQSIFFYTFTFGTKYAIVCSLFFNDYISYRLFFIIFLFGALFYFSLILFSNINNNFLSVFITLMTPKKNQNILFKIILIFFMLICGCIISTIGFGIFATTNRFDAARGYGFLIRILDVTGFFVMSYLSILSYLRFKKLNKNDIKQWFIYVFLFVVVLIYCFLNGAKASLILSVYVIVLSVKIFNQSFKIKFTKVIFLFLLSILFALFSLQINLKNNGYDLSSQGEYLQGVPILIEKFLHRILSNGNQSYMSLPYDVIDNIEKDSFLVRFISPFLGATYMSKILNYNVGDFSVGRQIMLYHAKYLDIAGGPTSHFDLFSYVYFGYFGVFFVIFLGFLLGSINNLLRKEIRSQDNKSIFKCSLLSTLWVKSNAIILEPTIGIAYIVDVVIFFLFINIFFIVFNLYFLSKSCEKYKLVNKTIRIKYG